MDTSMNQQAVEIISQQIASIPANTPMDHGTVGALKGQTKREGEAYGMALYFVKQMTGLSFGELPEDYTDEQKDAAQNAKEIAAAAIAKVGK